MPRVWSRQYVFVEVRAKCRDCDWTLWSNPYPNDHDAHHVNRRALVHSQRTKHRVITTVTKEFGGAEPEAR